MTPEEQLVLDSLLIFAIKELGEIADCIVKGEDDRPGHWKNELGDLCGLAIQPMLALAYPRRTCWCGRSFQPEFYNQVYCCRSHREIVERTRNSKYGKNLIKTDPKAAVAYYAYVGELPKTTNNY
jgi:hypothetical protein